MCFSATASLSAGIVLLFIGLASVQKVQHRSQFMFAAIPLLFAIQQFSEGILWLTLLYPDLQHFQKDSTCFFLIFAQSIWTLHVSISVLILEKRKTRENIQRLLIVIGLLVSCNLGYYLYNYKAHAEIDCYHSLYLQSYPEKFRIWGGLLYGVATILPSFFSHIRHMCILGITVLIFYIITAPFYKNYLLSVWCFFAPVISISVWIIMREIKTLLRTEIVKNL